MQTHNLLLERQTRLPLSHPNVVWWLQSLLNWDILRLVNYLSLCPSLLKSKFWIFMNYQIGLPCRVGLVVSVSTSHNVGHEFTSRPGHTNDHHKNGTNCLPAWHAMRLGRSLTVQPDYLKGRVVCGTVYGDMHLKDVLGLILRVGYCIPVPDFYLVLHGLCCRKSTIMN